MTGKEFIAQLQRIEQVIGQKGFTFRTLSELQKAATDLRSVVPTEGAFDNLTDDQKLAQIAELDRLRQALEKYADGSLNPDDIMAKKLASSRAIWALSFLAAAITLSLIVSIINVWGNATKGSSACSRSAAKSPPSPSAKPDSSKPEQQKPNSPPRTPANGVGGTSGAGGATPAGTGGNDAPSSGSGNEATAKKQPEVVPASTTLSTCESVSLTVPGAGDAEITWLPVSTGSLNDDGVYVAPSSIAGQQTLTLGATVKVAGGQPQTAKPGSIILMPPGGPDEYYVLIMIVLMGALGGCLHWLSGFALYVGNREFLRSWIAYYLLMPLEGAALAIIVYLLLRVGVLAPTSTSGQVTANLNTIGLYAFAGLTGIYSKQALQSLGDVFNVIFKKVEAKDQSKAAATASDPKNKTQ